jgi:ribosome maturation factor RimP
VYLDKPEGVSIADCEAVSRPLSDALDETDPIEGRYTWRSPPRGPTGAAKAGAFRGLPGQRGGREALPRPRRKKDVTGTLTEYREDGGISVSGVGGVLALDKKEIARVRLHVDF